MARAANKLAARQVQTIKEPGRYGDGNGLYLVVSKTGSKSWLYMFNFDGKRREMGLGTYPEVSLADARQAVTDAKALAKDGINPIEHRKSGGNASNQITFGQCADDLLGNILEGFSNEKHRQQWKMTLTKYGAPLWDKPVADISIDDVYQTLEPHWKTRPETASRLRGRIQRVLDYAITKGYRERANPAVWQGRLSNLLSRPEKLTRGHHRALDYRLVPQFLRELRQRNGVAALALQITLLTCLRTREIIRTPWSEFDFKKNIWLIPGPRMKGKNAPGHRVPLTPSMLAVLEQLKPFRRQDDLLFPGQREGQPISDMSLTKMLKDTGWYGKTTVHGLRSTYRDWVAEETSFPFELCEKVLAHKVGNAVSRAYQRGDQLERRRELMLAWNRYCDGLTADRVAEVSMAAEG